MATAGVSSCKYPAISFPNLSVNVIIPSGPRLPLEPMDEIDPELSARMWYCDMGGVEVVGEEEHRPVAVVVEVAGLPTNRHSRFVPEAHWEARNDVIAVFALQYRVGVVYL